MRKIFYLSPFLLFLLLLIDGQLTTLLTNVLPFDLDVTSRLLLFVLIIFSRYLPINFMMTLFTVLGFIYDAYYLDVIGPATVFFPIFSYLLSQVFKWVKFNLFSFMLLGIILVFLFETTNYFLSYFLNFTNINFDIFIVKTLAPTMFLNLLLGILLYPFLTQFFKNIRHKIVMNA